MRLVRNPADSECSIDQDWLLEFYLRSELWHSQVNAKFGLSESDLVKVCAAILER